MILLVSCARRRAPNPGTLWRGWVPALAAMTLWGCSTATPIAPHRIVSNNPCIDSVLAQIADPASIGAISRYSHDPSGGSAPLDWARRYPAVGTSAEELIAAAPRLVLTGNYASMGTNAALKRAGVRVEAFGVPATLAENRAQILAIARAIGREPQGLALAARIDAATRPQPRSKTAIIWLTGGFVPGQGTIQDELLARAGFRNASSLYRLKQWDVLPLETLLRHPPDVIFTPVAAHGDDARALSLRFQALRHLAGRARIVPFPEKLLLCGGPTVIAAMEVMHAAANGGSGA